MILQLSNKEVIVEEILLYESVGRIAKVLDQLTEGLKTLGFLRVMRAFPDVFAALFTSMTTVSPSDVLNCLKILKNLSKDDITNISPSDVLDCFKILDNLSEGDLPPCLAYGSSSER